MNFIPLASSSKGNAYLLQTDGVPPLLLEAGIPIKQIRVKLRNHGVSLSDLAGCLVSHEHGDHSKAVKDLLKAGVDCWMSEGTSKAIGMEHHHRICFLVESGSEITIASVWTVLPFALEHDATEPTGFFIAHGDDRLLFISDTAYVENRFEGVTMIAVECNFQDEILHENISKGYLPSVTGRRTRRNHMSLKIVKDFLLANDLSRTREIWLLHLSDGNSDELRMIKEIQEVTGVPVHAA